MKQKLNLALLFFSITLLIPVFSFSESPIFFKFEKIDIKNFIMQVSELTGKNFIIHPSVNGKISVVSAKPLSKKEVYKVFLSVLEVHGYSAIPSGQVIKILPSRNAKHNNLPTNVESSGSQMITMVVHVNNVSATQLIRVLRPLMPQQAHLTAYNATNSLIITDRADNVKRLIKIVKRIDQVSDAEVDIIPLKHASAAEIVRILNSLQRSSLQGKNIQHNVRLAADKRTNSILLSGERSSRIRLRAIISHMDTPLTSGGNTHVIYLRYVNAKKMVTLLSGISKSINNNKKGSATAPNTPTNIQADESNNAVVITAPPDIYRSLQQVITKLDIRPAQVLVEAIIVDMSLDKANELGLQWAVGKQDGKQGLMSGTNFGSSSSGSIASVAKSLTDKKVPDLSDGLNLLIGRFTEGKVNFAALITALKSDAETNVLSTPSLMTLDNKKAEIKVGQNVPFLTGQYTNNDRDPDGTVTPFQTIKREDVGIKLTVKPQINEGNAIMLEIDQEVSSISPSSAATDIITNKRTIKTTVMVDNGQVIVLGGLIDERLNQTRQKVPVLGSIPLLGKLFRYNRVAKEKRNLMIFLRPIIIKDATIQKLITSGKYEYIRQQQLQMRKRGIPLLPDKESPLLKNNFNNTTLPLTPKQQAQQVEAKQKAQNNTNQPSYFEGDPSNDEDPTSQNTINSGQTNTDNRNKRP